MRRSAAFVALVVGVAVGSPAGAAPKPQLVDPKGDYPVAGADLVSALFVTQKKSKLVVAVEFADVPNGQVPFAYQLRFTTDDGCNWRGNYFGETFGSSGGCAADDSSPPSVTVKGKTIVFTMAAKGKLKPGTELSGIAVSSTPGGVLSGAGGGDSGETDTTYVIGS